MQFLDLHSRYNFRGSYLYFLAQANEVQVDSIVEIGVWDGQNAIMMRCLFPKAHLYLVDPWSPTPEYFREGEPISILVEDYQTAYQKVCGYFKDDPMVTLLKMTSKEGAQIVPDGVDLVFIDGDHSYEHVKRDIELWKEKVRPGGLLTGHDYCDLCPGVIQAVDELLKGKFIVGRDDVWATVI